MKESAPARLLMCPPDHYNVSYEINPWMSLTRPVVAANAVRQWQELYRVLTTTIGVEVELISPVEGLPDLVFTANAGLVWGRTLILSNFRFKERAGEAPVFSAWFAEKGYEVVRLPADCSFEGEGDILPLGEVLVGGYRFRSDLRSHRLVAEITGAKVISLELSDPYFYHLDTCFWPITDELAFYYPGAFEACGRRLLQEHVPELVPVSRHDALLFGCNSVNVGNQVVLNAGCRGLLGKLRNWGYEVHEVDLSEFIKAGGSAKCLTLFLSRR
ncbi:MAG: amidinotransferase [Chloroflexi bacterium]|nr:amidinotransferase [Chloroflexota bacterium]